MKITNKLLLLFAIVLLGIGCKKDSHEQEDKTSLIGKWQAIERFVDIGDGNGKWYPITNGSAAYLQFKANGQFTGADFPGYTNYAVKDSASRSFLILTKNGKSPLTNLYKIEEGKVTINPLGTCIEGCGIKFQKL